MKILILGGAGMLGHQMFQQLRKHFGDQNVACTVRKLRSHYSRWPFLQSGLVFDSVDVSNFGSIETILNDWKPQWIINCIGLTLRKPELSDFEKCIEINSMLPHRLQLWSARNAAKTVHFSTDCVFDGKKGNYTELDQPTASDIYGKSKFLGEIAGSNGLTLRLSIVGREIEGKTELVEWFLSQKDKEVKGYAKAMYSGLTTNRVAKEVIRIMGKHPDISGCYQISSEPISKFDLLCRLNTLYDLNITVHRDESYVVDKTLNCERSSKLIGFVRPTWDEMLKEMKEEGFLYGV